MVSCQKVSPIIIIYLCSSSSYLLLILYFLISDLLSKVPGCNESVLFAKDGFTLLDEAKEFQDVPEVKEEIEIKINIEQSREAVDSHAHLLGKFITTS